MRVLSCLRAILVSLAAVCATPVPARAQAQDPVTVFAAASLRGALDDIARTYPAPVVVSYGGSGTMARQIALGAPADLVILASPDWMDWLRDQGALADRKRVDLLRNRLVLIGPAGARPLPNPDAAALLDALQGGRLAMGQRAAVPAGIYARAWLAGIGAWDALAPHLAETDNVRAALALVARGEATLGVVYATDAAADTSVDVLWTVPEDRHPPIVYPAAALSDAGDAFLRHLGMTDARDTFEQHGFLPIEPAR
ncbi:molybdate ABC transporter substrate-binding protein [Sulfitobacter sabulilitoris]|uniref:Molybdate ABC transporter substrate-binding protein n=1 Tax=Sulfitobacter sabulilitoris TaxID=2562655 RepID=A0A5S3PLQ8_9RHOB|nr:molybdate ABC transporter substrate-binding protein [Sulfitobacter sabulilitoris]TMM55196.1 molybdate ABC transporter substrate-binding protein [Sulfitobacter sabulilitoris]